MFLSVCRLSSPIRARLSALRMVPSCPVASGACGCPRHAQRESELASFRGDLPRRVPAAPNKLLIFRHDIMDYSFQAQTNMLSDFESHVSRRVTGRWPELGTAGASHEVGPLWGTAKKAALKYESLPKPALGAILSEAQRSQKAALRCVI